MERLPVMLVLLLLLPSLAAPLASAEARQVTLQVPAPRILAKFVPGIVEWPKLGRPCFTQPGGIVKVRLFKDIKVDKVIIDDGYGHSYSLEFSQQGRSITAKVPQNAAKGLYDLILVSGGKVYGEPHAVVVATAREYEKLYIVHVTDRHFGVINPNGRAAANYDLAADLIALGLPNNTIVIDTGDTADTARDIEYMESIWTDYLLNKPLVGIPGNHDHVGGSTNFIKYRGPWHYTLGIYGIYRIVGIDSGGDGYINTEQASWAKQILVSTKEPVKIVLFHHPHFTHLWKGMPQVFNVSSPKQLYNLLTSKKPQSRYMYIYSSWLTNKKALMTLIEGIYDAPAKRILVLSGHVHLDSYAEVHRADGTTINYVVTTATGGSVRPGDYHGFRVIMLTANGGIDIMGDGPYNARHASFDLEGVHVYYTKGPHAVSMALNITGTNVTKLMEKTVVALPLPSSYVGKKIHVELVNLDSYKLRCTPLGCVLYAYTNKPPHEGVVYKAIAYTMPDEKPPTITLSSIYPPRPIQGRQVVLEFHVADDSWGIERVEAKLVYPGGEMKLVPALMGSTVRIVVPPLRDVKEATVTLVAMDASGKKAVYTEKLVYITQSTATSSPSATSTPQTTGTTAAATTTTTTATSVAAKTATTATRTEQQATAPAISFPSISVTTPTVSLPPLRGGGNTSLLLAVLIVGVVTVYLAMALRSRGS